MIKQVLKTTDCTFLLENHNASELLKGSFSKKEMAANWGLSHCFKTHPQTSRGWLYNYLLTSHEARKQFRI